MRFTDLVLSLLHGPKTRFSHVPNGESFFYPGVGVYRKVAPDGWNRNAVAVGPIEPRYLVVRHDQVVHCSFSSG